MSAASYALGMSSIAQALQSLAQLPGVGEAVDQAREACTQLRWHNALRRRIPQAAAESRIRGARASAVLEGAEYPVEVVRELMVGATAWPTQPDPMEAVLRGAVQATAESEHAASGVLSAPAQALARLHVAASAGLADDGAVGRPRSDGETSRELSELPPAPGPLELPARLQGVYDVIAAHSQVPVPVVAAIAHAEVATMRPFVRGNGLVARALERAIIKAGGLDPTGVSVPEVGYAREGATGYAGALAAYATGTPDGVGLWLQFSAEALGRGAAEGQRIADAVLVGRLS